MAFDQSELLIAESGLNTITHEMEPVTLPFSYYNASWPDG